MSQSHLGSENSIGHKIRDILMFGGAIVCGFLLVFYFDVITSKFQQVMANQSGRPQLTSPLAPKNADNNRSASDARQQNNWASDEQVILQANHNGHFAARATINDEEVNMMVDTGATIIALSYETAEDIGLEPDKLKFKYQTRTANGIAKVAVVRLDEVRIGDIVVHDLKAIVAEPGRLHINLLGMNFLGALKKFEISGSNLILQQ